MPTSTFSRDLVVTSDPETCWAVLTDVRRLVTWVSVLQDAEEVVPLERYAAVLMDKLGPFKLKADLGIDVSEVEHPRHVRVRAAGEDRQVASRIAVDAVVELLPAEPSGTRVSVNGTYEVVGRVATMGGSTIRKKADKILEEFFSSVQSELGSSSAPAV